MFLTIVLLVTAPLAVAEENPSNCQYSLVQQMDAETKIASIKRSLSHHTRNALVFEKVEDEIALVQEKMNSFQPGSPEYSEAKARLEHLRSVLGYFSPSQNKISVSENDPTLVLSVLRHEASHARRMLYNRPVDVMDGVVATEKGSPNSGPYFRENEVFALDEYISYSQEIFLDSIALLDSFNRGESISAAQRSRISQTIEFLDSVTALLRKSNNDILEEWIESAPPFIAFRLNITNARYSHGERVPGTEAVAKIMRHNRTYQFVIDRGDSDRVLDLIISSRELASLKVRAALEARVVFFRDFLDAVAECRAAFSLLTDAIDGKPDGIEKSSFVKGISAPFRMIYKHIDAHLEAY